MEKCYCLNPVQFPRLVSTGICQTNISDVHYDQCFDVPLVSGKYKSQLANKLISIELGVNFELIYS